MGNLSFVSYLPENYRSKDKKYFSAKKIEFPQLEIKEFRDVTIIDNEFLLDKSGKLIKESCYHVKGWYKKYSLRAEERYKNASETGKIIELKDDGDYCIIVSPWAIIDHWVGFYHWMMESISRLIQVCEIYKNPIILMPEFTKDIDFFSKTLHPFQNVQIKYIPDDTQIHAERVILPELKHDCNDYDPENVEKIRQIYLKYYDLSVSAGKKIFISRQKAVRRRIINNQEVMDLIKKYDFNCVDFDDIPFDQQVSIMNSADTVVALHGAALTNVLFMPRKSIVLELHRRKLVPWDRYSNVYWNLCCVLGLRYYHQECEPVGVERRDFFHCDYKVDLTALEKNIKQILSLR